MSFNILSSIKNPCQKAVMVLILPMELGWQSRLCGHVHGCTQRREDVDSHCLMALLFDNVACLSCWEAEHSRKENLVRKCPILQTRTNNTSQVPPPSLMVPCWAAVAGREKVPWSPLDVTRSQNSIPAHKPHAFAECQLVGLKSLIHLKKRVEERPELSYDRQRMGQANLLLE